MTRINARKGRALAAIAGLALAGSACTDWAGYDLDYFWDALPVLSTMRGSVTYDPYDMPRLPAPNSVPLATGNGDVPGPFTQLQLDSAAATLTNPFAGSADPTVLARGQAVYTSQCFACHGPTGAGNGPVVGVGKFPTAPAINGAATAGRSDGYIYGVIAVGRGLMPAYGERVTHNDRWAVVSYLRALQRQGGAPATAAPVNPPDSVPGTAVPLVDSAGQQPQQQ